LEIPLAFDAGIQHAPKRMTASPASQTSQGSREVILRRIREALQLSAPARHLGDHGHPSAAAATAASSTPADPEQWLPAVPDDLPGRIELFCEISAGLKTRVIRCASTSAAAEALQQLAREGAWRTVFTHAHPLTNTVMAALPKDVAVRSTEGGYDKQEMQKADAGISGCESLIAQTASILVSPQSSGGRVLSVLVPHHVVVATTRQIVRDLREALEGLRQRSGGALPRYFSFITGPSRTGDIERILVLGAHGPKELTVLLLDEPESHPTAVTPD
jgi:L-lactate dehydrogenase complex protein LldG